jgi:hypothetical protein
MKSALRVHADAIQVTQIAVVRAWIYRPMRAIVEHAIRHAPQMKYAMQVHVNATQVTAIAVVRAWICRPMKATVGHAALFAAQIRRALPARAYAIAAITIAMATMLAMDANPLRPVAKASTVQRMRVATA